MKRFSRTKTERLFVAGILSCSLGFAGCGTTSTPSTEQSEASQPSAPARQYPHSSPEWKLASIDLGHQASDDETRPYARAIDLLQRRCPDSRVHLGDLAVTAVDLLKKANISTTILKVLRDTRASIPGRYPGRSCVDVFSAYVTLRKQG